MGYGDFYPVSTWGRITAVFVMIAGVGLIGVMASLLSGMLMGDGNDSEPEQAPVVLNKISALEGEVAMLNQKLDVLQKMLKSMGSENDPLEDS